MRRREPARRDPVASLLAIRLRAIIARSRDGDGLSLRAIARSAEVSHTVVERFLRGDPVSFDSFVALARWAGYTLTLMPEPPADRMAP